MNLPVPCKKVRWSVGRVLHRFVFLSLVLCSCVVVDEPSFHSDVNFPNAANEEQAETAIVWGRTAKNSTKYTVVMAFNDASSEASFGHDIGTNPSTGGVGPKFGASAAGFAYSLDNGTTWTHKKIRPPEKWAQLHSDPSLAVDPNDQSKIYYGFMAVSQQRWEEKNLGLPLDQYGNPLLPDGFCVAKSVDGGQNFHEISCTRLFVKGVTTANIDHTTIAIDAKGCLWAATEDITDLNGTQWRTRLFRSPPPITGACSEEDWKYLQEIQIPSEEGMFPIGPGERFPKLVSDGVGNIYLGTFDTNQQVASQLAVRYYQVAAGPTADLERWYGFIGVNPLCQDAVWPADPYPGKFFVALDSGYIRFAYPYDFSVDIDKDGLSVLRIVMQSVRVQAVTDLWPGKYIQTVEISQLAQSVTGNPNLACINPYQWGTHHTMYKGVETRVPGDQAMVAINAQRPIVGATPKKVQGDFYNSSWIMLYHDNITLRNFPGATPSTKVVSPIMQGIVASSTKGPIVVDTTYASAIQEYPHWPICDRSNYWGDYQGITHIPVPPGFSRISALSYSYKVPFSCDNSTGFANPLHVAGVVW